MSIFSRSRLRLRTSPIGSAAPSFLVTMAAHILAAGGLMRHREPPGSVERRAHRVALVLLGGVIWRLLGLVGPLLRGGVAACESSRELALRDQHLAGLGALVAGDDPAALQHVDQA